MFESLKRIFGVADVPVAASDPPAFIAASDLPANAAGYVPWRQGTNGEQWFCRPDSPVLPVVHGIAPDDDFGTGFDDADDDEAENQKFWREHKLKARLRKEGRFDDDDQ